MRYFGLWHAANRHLASCPPDAAARSTRPIGGRSRRPTSHQHRPYRSRPPPPISATANLVDPACPARHAFVLFGLRPPSLLAFPTRSGSRALALLAAPHPRARRPSPAPPSSSPASPLGHLREKLHRPRPRPRVHSNRAVSRPSRRRDGVVSHARPAAAPASRTSRVSPCRPGCRRTRLIFDPARQ